MNHGLLCYLLQVCCSGISCYGCSKAPTQHVFVLGCPRHGCHLPPMSSPPPPVHREGGDCHWLVPEKKTCQLHCRELRNCETSISELMRKSAHGTGGLGRTFWGQVVFHSGLPGAKVHPPKTWWPQQFLNPHPNSESSLRQSPLQPVRPSLSLMGNMCSCSRLCGTTRGSFTLSLFRRRGSADN